jgi:hypothetical protein
MGKWAVAHPRKNWVTKCCEQCGAEFEIPQWKLNQGKGKYCSKLCFRHASRAEDGVEYDGLWFARTGKNQYYWHKRANKTTVSLHRYVWEQHFGPIPDGFVVHHIDHDPANNTVENLELLDNREHARRHLIERIETGALDLEAALEKAREAAKVWHRSPEGREWHRQHTYRSLHKDRPDPASLQPDD